MFDTLCNLWHNHCGENADRMRRLSYASEARKYLKTKRITGVSKFCLTDVRFWKAVSY